MLPICFEVYKCTVLIKISRFIEVTSIELVGIITIVDNLILFSVPQQKRLVYGSIVGNSKGQWPVLNK